MSKVKVKIVEEFSERTAIGVDGSASFDPAELPKDLNLPSKAWLAKRWRKWKAYERVWEEACQAHENNDRNAITNKFKQLDDPIDFFVFLLDFNSVPTSTAKIGGDTKNALSKPMSMRARRLFKEKKSEWETNGKNYSQRQFAESHRKELSIPYEARLQEIQDLQLQINRLTKETTQRELTAAQLKHLREQKRALLEKIRFKPILPSIKTIEGWLKGL